MAERKEPEATTSLAYLPCCDMWEDTSNDSECGGCGRNFDDPEVWGEEDPTIAVYALAYIMEPDGTKTYQSSDIQEEEWRFHREVGYCIRCKGCGGFVDASELYDEIKDAINHAEKHEWKDGFCPDCHCKELTKQLEDAHISLSKR